MNYGTGSLPDWPGYMAQQAARVKHPALSAFYGVVWPTADTPLEDVHFVALDVETTGLNARTHSIVSIGIVPLTLDRIHANECWHTLVRPRGGLVEESVTFHQITHSDVRQAPPFEAILEPLLHRLAGKVVVAHYHPVERQFLDAAVRRCCGETLLFPMVDTMQIEANLHPKRKPGWVMRLLGRTPVSIRLAESRRRYGLPAYRAHHALTDALATAELLQAQVATHFSARQAIASLWI